MTNLLPCPFCGGEAEWWQQFGWDRQPLGHMAGCCSCGIQTWICDTKDQAIEAWNTRACEECERGAIPATEENMREHGWVRERTCHIKGKRARGLMHTEAGHCSECGTEIVTSTDVYTTKYCPYCGAKVVKVAE